MRTPSTFALWSALTFFGLQGCSGQSDALAANEGLDPELVEIREAMPIDENWNVIIVSFDALRADALGTYGYERPTSPVIDEFARQSLVFEAAYTAAPVSPTSFAAAFTGMLPMRVFHAWNLSSDETLAAQFAAAGYRTGAFVNNVHLSPERNFDAGFQTYEYHRNDPDEDILAGALAWMDGHEGERLFAWVHFLSPHAPYDYRDFAEAFYDESYEGKFSKTTMGKFEAEAPEDIQRIRDLYDGEVLYSDRLFEQFLEGLRERGLLERSIVVLTSDHGEEFMDHGGFQHGKVYEETLRVPLIIHHPGMRQGARSELLVSNVDFFPTLLAAVGIDYPGQLDGKNLLALRTPTQHVLGVSMTGGQRRAVSLRRGRLKLIHNCVRGGDRYVPGTPELYDLETDPGETRDLAAERPELVIELQRELELIAGGEVCTLMQRAMLGRTVTVGMDLESIEALRALGYVGDDE